jgi:NADPH:quinone reductase-like Zn-dependent oxidoreductase
VLFHAAAGGVGLIAGQWLKALGVTTIGTVGSDDKAKLAKAHGYDHTIVYTRENFAERVKEITGGAKLPVVFDSVGKDTFMGSLDCLQTRGMLVVFGNGSGPVPAFELNMLAKGSFYVTPTDAHVVHGDARGARGGRERAVRRGEVRQGEDRGQPEVRAQGRETGAPGSGGTQDDRIYGTDSVEPVRQ